MNKRWNRIVGSVLFLLFIGVGVILSTFHREHRSDGAASHDAGTCPVCQLANTPVVTSPSHVTPVSGDILADEVVIHVSIPGSPCLREPTQARAPPVC